MWYFLYFAFLLFFSLSICFIWSFTTGSSCLQKKVNLFFWRGRERENTNVNPIFLLYHHHLDRKFSKFIDFPSFTSLVFCMTWFSFIEKKIDNIFIFVVFVTLLDLLSESFNLFVCLMIDD